MGWARQGGAWQGEAGHGAARRGVAWQGKAGKFYFGCVATRDRMNET